MLCLLYKHLRYIRVSFFFFFNDTATTEIYTLSLHDALPISGICWQGKNADTPFATVNPEGQARVLVMGDEVRRSEEHTSELQSQSNLVCRLLLEKKKKKDYAHHSLWTGCRKRTYSRMTHSRV